MIDADCRLYIYKTNVHKNSLASPWNIHPFMHPLLIYSSHSSDQLFICVSYSFVQYKFTMIFFVKNNCLLIA